MRSQDVFILSSRLRPSRTDHLSTGTVLIDLIDQKPSTTCVVKTNAYNSQYGHAAFTNGYKEIIIEYIYLSENYNKS